MKKSRPEYLTELKLKPTQPQGRQQVALTPPDLNVQGLIRLFRPPFYGVYTNAQTARPELSIATRRIFSTF